MPIFLVSTSHMLLPFQVEAVSDKKTVIAERYGYETNDRYLFETMTNSKVRGICHL